MIDIIQLTAALFVLAAFCIWVHFQIRQQCKSFNDAIILRLDLHMNAFGINIISYLEESDPETKIKMMENLRKKLEDEKAIILYNAKNNER